MKSIPELSDLSNLQKQISAIYDHLNVTPVMVAKTRGMGLTLIERGKDAWRDEELHKWEWQFDDNHIPMI